MLFGPRTTISVIRTLIYGGLGGWYAATTPESRGQLDAALLGGVFADYATWIFWTLTRLPGNLANGCYEAAINAVFGWFVLGSVVAEIKTGDEDMPIALMAFMLVMAIKVAYYGVQFFSDEVMDADEVAPNQPVTTEFVSDVLDGVIDGTAMPVDSSPGARYVNGLLLDMIERGATSVNLRSSETAPEVPLPDGSRLAVDGVHVINRLKVMSGLNPGAYLHPVEGGFRFRCADGMRHVRTHFEEIDGICVCSVEVDN